jgi:hypothetical protein
MPKNWALLLAVSTLAGSSLVAQTFRGRLTGVITDPSGAVVAEAQVELTNLATGVPQRVASNEQGIYLFPAVEPGQYRLTASMSGFKTFVQEPITIPVGGSLTLDVQLEVGDMTERVTVTAEAPLLESETVSFGQVVSERFLSEMPLNARNPMMLVTLTPGVIPHTGFFSRDGVGTGNIEQGRDQFAAAFQVGGSRHLSNEIYLDGAPNTSVDRGYMAYIPPVDSTQEFKVEANPFSAEFDRTTGAVINLVTKGGSNELRGTAYEFYRSSRLDANDFFFNRAGRTDKPIWHRNQFGFHLGGPLRRDRTFFFVNYEGLRQLVPFSFTTTVPTAAQRRGDFSDTRSTDGRLIVIYDPLTTRTDSAGGAPSRVPFPSNVIPPQRFDRVGAALLNAYPMPNQPGDPFTNARNHFMSDNGRSDMNNYGGRIDHVISASNRIFGRFSFRKDRRTAANPYGPAHPATYEGAPTDRAYNVTISDVHTFTPSVMGELRASFARHHTAEISPSYGFDLTSLGFPASFAQVAKPFFPKISVSDLSSMGRDRFYNQVRDTLAAQGALTTLAGRHSIKTGWDFRIMRFHLDRNLNSTGTYSFNRGMTQGPDPLRASAVAGHGAASLLLGAGASGNITHTDVFTLNRHYYAFYLQDNWKLTNRFTLNLGLRYNLEVGQNESHDRIAYLNLDAPNPLGQKVGLPLRGLLGFVGRGGVSRNLVDTDRNNFGPRVGFAWRLGGNTVIRSGYGIFYAPQWIEAYDANMYASFNSTTDWVSTLDGLRPENYISNPYPKGFSLPKRDRDPLTNVGATISGWIRNEPVGYVQQWNFTLQRQLSSSLLVEAAYWGNKGTKLQRFGGVAENQLPNQFLALRAALNELVPNPFYGLIERGALSGPTVARRQLLLPFPQYTAVNRTGPSLGNSIYHAFTLRVEQRFSRDVSVLASYTLAKQIDDFEDPFGAAPLDRENLRLERSVSSFDTPQRLVVSYVYEFPFGRNKRLGRNWHGILEALGGGWSLAGITTLQSGPPVAVSRPAVNLGRSAKITNPTIDRWFDTTVFGLAEPFTFGNVGRRLPDVRSHGLKTFDFALAKSFRLTERVSLKFRAEAFNAFNTPQFATPSGAVGTAAFGRVSSQLNRPRSVQFGLQLYW